MKYFANFLVVLTLLFGCEGEETAIPDQDANYFPLRTGVYQIYNVKETRYQTTSLPVESTFQLMTHIVDSFPSGVNQFTFVIRRSMRTKVTDEWHPVDTWSVRNENSSIVVGEGNTWYVKLCFPFAVWDKWNGNAYNSMGEDEYALMNVRQPLEVNGITFTKTVTVEQEHNDDFIVYRDERREIYAESAGLIYSKVAQLDYCTADECLGQQKVDEGVEMEMTIVEYGRK